ncbi:MAG: transporter substrate-binding domain-containing protein, partial [Alphaproteobacteria bacterium]|nr:transporter substrate-binding domain-containing protein [Alphaproteobacteria bacterium]
MKLSHAVLTVVISAAVAFAVARYAAPPSAAQNNALARVLRTNTLRCGYYMFPPITMRDSNTGKMSGFAVDMMNYIAKKADLKVKWAEEISFGNWAPALQSKRFDAVCTPLFADMSYNRAAEFTRPMFFSSVLALVRAGDNRFASGNIADLNRPGVTIATQEGNMTDSVAHELFPKAKILAVPQGVDYGVVVQNVIDRKADIALWDRNGFLQYDRHDPGKIRMLRLNQPLKLIPLEFAVGQGQDGLRDFLNGAVENMLDNGEMDRL